MASNRELRLVVELLACDLPVYLPAILLPILRSGCFVRAQRRVFLFPRKWRFAARGGTFGHKSVTLSKEIKLYFAI